MKLGNLEPIEAALAEIIECERDARQRHGDAAAVEYANARSILQRALEEAETTGLEMDVQTYADAHGISKWSVYRAIRTGKIRSKRKPGRGIVIPVGKVA